MKRKIILLLLVLVVAFSATASAKPNDHRRPDQRQRVERHEKNRRVEKQEKNYRNDRYERNHRNNVRVERKAPPKKWDHPSYRSNNWHKTRHSALPFTWHQHRDRIYRPGYIVERIYDYGWTSRFPGLHPYRWHARNGVGFWYQGRHITDAVMFYDSYDQLVGIGFMHNGTFLFIRDDNHGFENRDSFFFSWRW